MSKQTAIRLPDETHARLQALAARTGRPAAFYIRQAIEKHLCDMENAYACARPTRLRPRPSPWAAS